MKVVVVVQDSLPNSCVGKDTTPTLWRLIGGSGGWCRQGGRSVLASSTFPNHASFVTGVDVAQHRIYTNKIWKANEFVCASSVGPAVETIFDAAKRNGLTTAAVMGDYTMIGVTAAQRADVFWPPAAELSPDCARDSLGYAANSAIVEQVDQRDALQADLCLIHMNEPDSALHVWGPGSDEVRDQILQCDNILAGIVERLQPDWGDTVLFVLSDHAQEAIDQTQPELYVSELLDKAGLAGHGHDEGAAALVVEGADAAALTQLPGIAGALDVGENTALVWSDPGRVFGQGRKNRLGQHGSPRTTTQVATVSGGHPLVPVLAQVLNKQSPYATQWAPTIAACFGINLPAATSISLISPL